MENTAEFTQGKNLASENFLTEELHIARLPTEFSFNDEIKYGLQSFEKWSKESNKEVSGVLFVNAKDKICLKELQKGEPWGVPIGKHDLSNFSNDKIDKYLKDFHPFWPQTGQKEFILLPENYSNIPTPPFGSRSGNRISINLLLQGQVIERGKRILGSIHTHPSGNPPSAGDFTNVNFKGSHSNRECLNGVLSDGNLYLMLKTNETPLLEIDILTNGEHSKSSYEKEMDKEVDKLVENGLSLKDAMSRALGDYCYQNNVALYEGKIADNKFKRVV